MFIIIRLTSTFVIVLQLIGSVVPVSDLLNLLSTYHLPQDKGKILKKAGIVATKKKYMEEIKLKREYPFILNLNQYPKQISANENPLIVLDNFQGINLG